MDTHPSVFLVRETDEDPDRHLLYLGEFSTLDGLRLLEPSTRITTFELHQSSEPVPVPAVHDVAAAIAFLQAEEHIDMVDFNATLEGVGSLSTHDDGECHFRVRSLDQVRELIEKSAPEKYAESLMAGLLAKPNHYLTLTDGEITSFASFDAYLASEK